jgi:hypothetical protein
MGWGALPCPCLLVRAWGGGSPGRSMRTYGRRVRAMLAEAVEALMVNRSTARRLARVSRNAWALSRSPVLWLMIGTWEEWFIYVWGGEETWESPALI